MSSIRCVLLCLIVLSFTQPSNSLLSADQNNGQNGLNQNALQVMTFNIRFANPNDGDHIWPNRKEMVASIIRFHQADLIGMQEVLKSQIEDLEELLPEYKWLGVGRNDGREAGEFVPIFYRADRLELLSDSAFWMSETPEVPGSKSWDAAITRVTMIARFKDKRTGQEFHHFNTHFDHKGNQARIESARLLMQKAGELNPREPVVVTGDFNCLEEHTPYKVLVGKEGSGGLPPDGEADTPGTEKSREDLLFDTRYRSAQPHHGPDTTWNGFKEQAPGMTIDYIFTTANFDVHRHGTLSETWNNRFPSDHFPVLAEIELKGSGDKRE